MNGSGKQPRESGSGDFRDLERRIGYRFANHDELTQALTHASLRNGEPGELHYERLEFLGDRVLGLCIADMLHRNFPQASEGELAVRLNLLVNGKTLAEISDALHLHEFIRAGPDIRSLTHKRMQSVRADVLEALIASIYLDGGLSAAMQFVQRFWSDRLHTEAAARQDSKTQLQEWAHARRLGTPAYAEVSRFGPDHEPEFTVTVELAGLPPETGRGRSKRVAEQAAARALLMREGALPQDLKEE